MRRPSGAEQLEQVEGCSHQFPFAADIRQAAPTEAPETALFLDLPKTRSTMALRILYTARPASVRSLCRIASLAVASTGGGSLASRSSVRVSCVPWQ
jgi:hypothetical protein